MLREAPALQQADAIIDLAQVCHLAPFNLSVMMLTTTRFLRQRDLPLDGYWHAVGQQVAPMWAPFQTRALPEIARAVAANMVSAASELVAFEADAAAQRATFLIGAWPPAELAQTFDVAPRDAQRACELFRPILAALSVEYAWRPEAGGVRVTIWRCAEGAE